MRFFVTATLVAFAAGTIQPASATAWTLGLSTYFGGSDMTTATAVAVDGSGNVFVAGWTVSTTLPGCSPIRPWAGGVDAFVAKWDGATHLLDYCTFLGGSGDDRAFAIAVDGSGYAYVTGWTMSVNFPLSGAFQTILEGSRNAFVAKLNPAGALVYSSYLGGSGSDAGNAIAVDGSGRATVVGDTTSSNFPLAHPIQGSFNGQTSVFVTRLSPAGNALVYSTFLGGSGSNHGAAVALDGTGAAYLTGSTTSMNFPTLSAFQPTSGGNQDAFVAKIDNAGDSLVYSTYLGGSGGTVGLPETGSAIAVDSAGDAYVTGTTSSPNFPLANALFSTSAGVGIHAFVTELNPAGSGLVYSTYLGGSSVDQGTAIAVDSGGNAVVAGFTASPDFPLANPTQALLAGSYDTFIARLNSTGTALLESTFFGGSGSDAANAVAYGASNAVYVVGQTQSLNLPIENATQPALAGAQNAFLAVFTLPAQQPAISSITPNPVSWEQLTTLTVNGSNFQSGFTASVSVGSMNFPLSAASLTFVSATEVQVPVYMGGATAYTATLNITNPGGLTASQNFQVSPSGGNLQPAISSITPNPVTWEQLTTLTVNGSNFQSGFTASVSVGSMNFPLSAASLTFVSATEVQVPVYMGGATAYTAALSITNPGGLTASQNFQVSPSGGNLQPAINSITPNPVTWEQQTTLTVNGSNFESGFTASVSVGSMNFPLSAASLTFVSSTEVQVPVYMGGATAYTATLNITNPGGLTVSQNFQVSPSGGNLQPAINSITPNPVTWEQLTTLTVNGSNFQSGFTASVSVGSMNIPLSAASLNFVSAMEVQVPVYMGGATAYMATLNITNPGGLTASQNFQVSPSGGNLQPAISSITPNPVPWEQLTTLTVNGSNFQSGFTASVSVGSMNFPLSAASLTFVSATEVQVPVYMGGATAYTATLNITNPGGLTVSRNFQVVSSGGGG